MFEIKILHFSFFQSPLDSLKLSYRPETSVFHRNSVFIVKIIIYQILLTKKVKFVCKFMENS